MYKNILSKSEQIIYETFKASIRQRISEHILYENVDINVIKDYLTQDILYQLDMFFASKVETKKEEVKHKILNFTKPETCYTVKAKSVKRPKTWWDSFKIKFFPKWLLKKTKVEYETITRYMKYVNVIKEEHHITENIINNRYLVTDIQVPRDHSNRPHKNFSVMKYNRSF